MDNLVDAEVTPKISDSAYSNSCGNSQSRRSTATRNTTIMDNLDDSENNAKVSDSAYSTSCSNSQSRRSHSSKSTHSGSHSSGSSGYGGQKSTSSSSNNATSQPPEKRSKDKEVKKKKPLQINFETKTVAECRGPDQEPPVDAIKKEELCDVIPVTLSPPQALTETAPEKMDISIPEGCATEIDIRSCSTPMLSSPDFVTSCPVTSPAEGFSCVVSMHDGVVMYTTSSLTTSLGFPKDLWIGRSFIDFVHTRDRNTFASQITNGLAVPKNVLGAVEKAPLQSNSFSRMVCRIRRYRGLNKGFGVKEKMVTYTPFLLKFHFKSITDEEGKATYLVIQATPVFSMFKVPNEILSKPVPFVIRHAANGNLEYIDLESVPYLGYLPQDLKDKDTLQLYHPEDLIYLRQLYEGIVKEGGVPRSKSLRIIAQNGFYLKVETEWSSFINPWSRKLEFVIAKHFIMEGPSNPDVFQSPEIEQSKKLSDEDRAKVQALKDSIIRLINEVPTRPAEVAKQQMSKRCQDLASFMESLMEDQPKTEDELRIDLQEPANSYYERDSVMLGGISPHHEYNDSKSSTETPLSYNQLNFNENLQRYFDSHQPFSYEDYRTVTGENVLDFKKKLENGRCLSPLAQQSGDSNDISTCGSCQVRNCSPTLPMRNCSPIRLTESLLLKHNAEMEKDLKKHHRENRLSGKGKRDKSSNEKRLKKKEHLARCNAAFQPTSATITDDDSEAKTKSHGVKRSSKPNETELVSHKHHCSSQSASRRCINATAGPTHTPTTSTTVAHWPTNRIDNMNTFILGVGMPQQMSVMGPMAAMPANMFPMYYTPTTRTLPPGAVLNQGVGGGLTPFNTPFNTPVMMYGQPFMCSGISPSQVTFPMPSIPQTMSYPQSSNALGLTSNNYEENTETNAGSSNGTKRKNRMVNSDETVDRTDGESSYSSFYSSFFKTESCSAEDSGGDGNKQNPKVTCDYYGGAQNKVARRKMEPPWMEQVCLTPELIYKYQIMTKSVEEVLQKDKLKMQGMEQPSMVNEQLGQLYLDLQLQGVAARLTLEEGITSSSSSGEECSTIGATSKTKRKRNYSKLVMIFEEDASLPPTPEPVPVPTTADT